MIESIQSFSLAGGKSVNEDTVVWERKENRLVGIVADGLGGQGLGDVASMIAAEYSRKLLLEAKDVSDSSIGDLFGFINNEILKAQQSYSTQTMTTIAFVFIEGKNVLLGHLGDTRIYWYQFWRQKYVSVDHSLTQLYVKQGKISKDEMRGHPTRNILLRGLGMKEYSSPELYRGRLFMHDRIFLCSDGLWEMFTNHELSHFMAGGDAKRNFEALQREVEKRIVPDHSDNISALLLS